MIKSSDFPKISFGIIVLDGEPFTKYLLRQLYPHAFEIIVVEGGSQKTEKYAPNGHAKDCTLEVLYKFRDEEDPEKKIQIITKVGFWNSKDEQSRAYADRATGDYLWQVDIDEFYTHRDIHAIRKYLKINPGVDTISFKQVSFWGSPGYTVQTLKAAFTSSDEYHRLFKWDKKYKYSCHRPPTIVDDEGKDLREKNWVRAKEIEKLGIYLYHYSLLFPKQVINKCSYYSNSIISERGGGYLKGLDEWADQVYFHLTKPFRVHTTYTYISWLKKYRETHPEQIELLWKDIQNQRMNAECRNMDDVDSLLMKKYYRLAGFLLALLAAFIRLPVINRLAKGYLFIRIKMKKSLHRK